MVTREPPSASRDRIRRLRERSCGPLQIRLVSCSNVVSCVDIIILMGVVVVYYVEQESPADAVKSARRKSVQKLLQFDVFRFISPNSIYPNCQCIASRGRPMFSQALGLYNCTQFEIRCLPIIKFLVQIAST